MQRHHDATHCHTLVTLCLGALAIGSATAQTAVSPADRTNLEGSSFTHFPLGRPNARFQFLHSDLPAGMVIHGHAFRRDAAQVRGVVDGFLADLEVTLSLSPNTPSQASATFANNIGNNPVQVLPRTVLVFPATDRPALDPSPTFDLMVPYTVPFVMPTTPATLCVDTVMYGNTSAAGVDRNLSIYLDAHETLSNGTSEQAGFRTGSGCGVTPGGAAAFATMSMWHLGAALRLDVAARNGIPDDGSGHTLCWLGFGTNRAITPWPTRTDCNIQVALDDIYVLGHDDGAGNFDGSIASPAILPPGLRFWLQVGSTSIGSPDLIVSDLTAMMTPALPPTGLTAVRVAASTNRLAATGAVSSAVPVTQFF